MKKYQKIWIQHNGPIPKDNDGRSYEIHHRDGNHTNNDIENLQCITIQEHYEMHLKQGDYGACMLIAKRMNLPPNHLSIIQKGCKRPGIGGVPKGTIPWNKGLTKEISDILKKNGERVSETQKGIRKQSSCKITISDVIIIRKLYKQREKIEGVGVVRRNGVKMSYEQAFALKYAPLYKVTTKNIIYIITNKTWQDVKI